MEKTKNQKQSFENQKIKKSKKTKNHRFKPYALIWCLPNKSSLGLGWDVALHIVLGCLIAFYSTGSTTFSFGLAPSE